MPWSEQSCSCSVGCIYLRHLQRIRTEHTASPRVPKMPHLMQSVLVSYCHPLVQLDKIAGESMTPNTIWIQGFLCFRILCLGTKKMERNAQSTWLWQKRKIRSRNWRDEKTWCGFCIHLKFISVNSVMKKLCGYVYGKIVANLLSECSVCASNNCECIIEDNRNQIH